MLKSDVFIPGSSGTEEHIPFMNCQQGAAWLHKRQGLQRSCMRHYRPHMFYL